MRTAHGWPVWGHDGAVESLKSAIARQRPRHALLIGGPASVGKATLATAFAQALLCDAPPEPGVACGKCRACRKVRRGVHPDVQIASLDTQAAQAERSGSKNTTLTIETVRRVCADAALRPMEGKWRISIIKDAEALQPVAQEALLKTLEEPPSYMMLLLLSDDVELLLPTIRSRCQIIELRPVPRDTIEASLVASGASPDHVIELADMANGRPGWAHRALQDRALVAERRDNITQSLDWIQASPYERQVTAYRLGESFTKRREEVFADLELLTGLWRDVLLLGADQPSSTTFRSSGPSLGSIAERSGLAATYKAITAVQQCIADLESNVRPRLALQSMVLQWPNLT